MTCMSKLHEALPQYYGMVVATGLGAFFVNFYLIHKVMQARKAYDVAYPALYSPTSTDFNCVQRAHQNYLEQLPQFLFLLTLGGLQYPRFAAGCGIVFLAGRVFYAHGYYTGDPQKRNRGSFGYAGMLGLLGSCVSLIVHLHPHMPGRFFPRH